MEKTSAPQKLKSVLYLLLFILLGLYLPLNALSIDEAKARLQEIHSRLHLIHGSLLEEYPEQLMSAMYLESDAKVLELGANTGRNSCVIASILNNSNNLVAVESFPEYAKLLQENRDINGLNFYIEPSAISKAPLIQSGWKTKVSNVDIPGFTRVNIISFDEVQKKYNISFDTLVVDCESCLYYILLDDPGILRNIKMVIIENDFDNIAQMLFVQERFNENGLQLVYNQAGGQNAKWAPCCDYFYQVWQKPVQ